MTTLTRKERHERTEKRVAEIVAQTKANFYVRLKAHGAEIDKGDVSLTMLFTQACVDVSQSLKPQEHHIALRAFRELRDEIMAARS